MRKRIVFQDNMEALAADENALQGYVQDWGDTLVVDFLQASGDRGYAGLAVSRKSASVVSVAKGRLYDGSGRMFGLDGATDVDLTSYFPSVSPRIVAIVIYGDTVSAATTVRNFIDPSTEEAVPKSVSLESQRIIRITVVAGTEAGTPVAPAITSTYLGVAYVRLTATGVAAQSSITQITDNEITALDDLAGRITALEAWKKTETAATAALRSDFADLARQVKGLASTTAIATIAKEVARIREAVGLPDTYSSSHSDAFLSTDESWIGHAEWNAKVEEGIRFAPDNMSEVPLALLSSLDSTVTISAGGLMLPKYSEEITLNIGDTKAERDVELAMSQFQVATISGDVLALSRLRQRYGEEFVVCSNSRYWLTGEHDNASVFIRDGETWTVEDNVSARHQMTRLTRFFDDSWEDAYWKYGTTPKSVTGRIIAQTRLATANRWVTGYGLLFSQVGTSGDVTLLVTAVSEATGKPDLTQIYAHTTVAAANLQEGKWTKFALDPFVMLKGYRYAIVVMTVGNHFLWSSNSNDYTQGTLYTFVDDDFAIALQDRDMCFQEFCAKFKSTSTTVNLQPWNLSGGIASIDVLAPCWRSQAAKIVYQFKVNNTWYSLDKISGATPFTGLPAMVQARIAMTHTQDIAPGIRLDTSRVRLSRPRTSARYISKPWTTPASVTSVSMTLLLGSYVVGTHTCLPKLRTGSGYTTVVSPASTTISRRSDGIAVLQAVFNIASATQYCWQVDMTTTSALLPYVVEEITDFAV